MLDQPHAKPPTIPAIATRPTGWTPGCARPPCAPTTAASRRTTPDALWDAATSLRLSDTRTLGRLVRWRIPDLDRGLTYGELFRAYPFTVLEEGERHLLAGLCGRIWTLARDYPRLAGPDEFARWDEPGTVRVLFGHWVQECDGGRRRARQRGARRARGPRRGEAPERAVEGRRAVRASRRRGGDRRGYREI